MQPSWAFGAEIRLLEVVLTSRLHKQKQNHHSFKQVP